MWNLNFAIQLFTAFIGTLGFSIMFKLDKKHLVPAMLAGGFTFFVYYVIEVLTASLFLAAFIASIASAVISELLARVRHAPTILFILPCAIPIVPGGSLYNAMFHLISKKLDLAWQYLANTLLVAIGIAGGLAAVTLVLHIAYATVAYAKAKANAK